MITNRDVLEWNDANSEEFDTTTTHRVVVSMPEHNVSRREVRCVWESVYPYSEILLKLL